MSAIGQSERATQNRVIALFRDELKYDYLGDWTDRANSNVEEKLLTAYLTKSGYSAAQVSRALDRLRTEANNPNRSLYDNNKAVYSLLRYGVPVKTTVGENTETVKLIDWGDAAQNDFAIAEEVTLHGNHERRPDLVLYVNGIAVGVIELKNSRVSIGDGIRLNTDLAKKPLECLEYIVVHELAHLLEPTHNQRFTTLMDQFMPKWKFYKEQLNRLPVRHENWEY